MILGWILTSSAFCDRIPSTQLAPSVSRVVARRHATTTESRPFGPFAPKPRTPEAEGGVGPPPHQTLSAAGGTTRLLSAAWPAERSECAWEEKMRQRMQWSENHSFGVEHGALSSTQD